MRFAVISDIHGNVLALEAVLADIDRHAVASILDLGDRVSGPLWPRETFDLLVERGIAGVRGNHDRLAGRETDTGLGPSDLHAFAALDPERRRMLAALPFRLEPAPGILAFHASPAHDDRYLIDDIRDGRLVRGPLDKIRRRLGAEPATLVLVGHSHHTDLVRLPEGPLILNPGSVGCPGYHDETGQAHVSEAGTPLARYALVEWLPAQDPDITFRALPYDSEAAARQAERNGRPEWAMALRLGVMPAVLGGSGA